MSIELLDDYLSAMLDDGAAPPSAPPPAGATPAPVATSAAEWMPVPAPAVETIPASMPPSAASATPVPPPPSPQAAAQRAITPQRADAADHPASPPLGNAAAMALLAASEPVRLDRRASARISRWLRFRVNGEAYAVEVLKVQEALRVPDILPLRCSPPALLGAMSLRGEIVPVMDFARWLGVPTTPPDADARVVVLVDEGNALGLLVSEVADVVHLSDAMIEPAAGLRLSLRADAIRGIARHDDGLTILLDARHLLE